MIMKRTGDCKRCGECCRNIAFTQETLDWKTLEFLMMRFARIEARRLPSGSYVLLVEHECPQLRKENDKYKCALHGSARKPQMCQKFPEDENAMLKGCTYRFVEDERAYDVQ